MPAPWPQHKKDAVLADYDANMGLKAIAKKHGCSPDAVLKWAREREVLRSERRSRLPGSTCASLARMFRLMMIAWMGSVWM